jgi:hypothetical protein
VASSYASLSTTTLHQNKDLISDDACFRNPSQSKRYSRDGNNKTRREKNTRKAHIDVRKNKTWVRFRCRHTVAGWCVCHWSHSQGQSKANFLPPSALKRCSWR